MTDLAPLLIGLAALVAVLSYGYRLRGMSRDERLAELRTVARGGERAAQAWVEAEIKRGSGWKRWVALVLVGLSGGVLASPEGRAVAMGLTARMVAYATEATSRAAEESDDERFRRPEWFETRVIDGVPASRYLDELETSMRKRILSHFQGAPLGDVGLGILHGDSIGVAFEHVDGAPGVARVAFDWTRWHENGYRDETAARVAEEVRSALR